eukprot:10373162-Ditylum_brightwellii.AAC.1
MSSQCEDKKPYREWKCSVKAHSIIVIEVYPKNINCSCPGFQCELSKCRLAHPQLDKFRCGVLVVNVGEQLLYIADALHINIHAGLFVRESFVYVNEMKQKGHIQKEVGEFDC